MASETFSDCVILSDSILKYMEGISGTHVIAFRGAQIQELTELVVQGDSRLSGMVDARVIVLHVGTNNVDRRNKMTVDKIIQKFRHLIATVQVRCEHARIIISAIIPRLKDLDATRDDVIKINKLLRDFEASHGVKVIPTFKRFLYANEIVTTLYADDHLHPNWIGNDNLLQYFTEQIKYFRSGLGLGSTALPSPETCVYKRDKFTNKF